jgi:hypothetical protein
VGQDWPESVSQQSEQELIGDLQSALDCLDDLAPAAAEPQLAWITAQLEEHRTVMRRRLIRDLALFVVFALALLTGVACILLKLPALFIIMQIVSFVAIPIVLFKNQWKRVRQP